jgi:hypothetical protein
MSRVELIAPTNQPMENVYDEERGFIKSTEPSMYPFNGIFQNDEFVKSTEPSMYPFNGIFQNDEFVKSTEPSMYPFNGIFHNEYVKMVEKIVPTQQTMEQLKPFVE